MSVIGPRELAVLDEGARMLAEAESLEAVKAIRDRAEAARSVIKAAQLGIDLQNRAAEIKLRAERKAGSFLRSLRQQKRNRTSKGQPVRVALGEIGISEQQSTRWQKLALVPEEEFRHYLREMTVQMREVTSSGLLRIAADGNSPSLRKDYSPGGALPLVDEELLWELAQHCQLLDDVLRPVIDGGQVELREVEKRVVDRLIGEMHNLIWQLRRARPACGGGDSNR